VTVRKGHMLAIPLDLEEALVILRAY